jgi:hypothetical protein
MHVELLCFLTSSRRLGGILGHFISKNYTNSFHVILLKSAILSLDLGLKVFDSVFLCCVDVGHPFNGRVIFQSDGAFLFDLSLQIAEYDILGNNLLAQCGDGIISSLDLGIFVRELLLKALLVED